MNNSIREFPINKQQFVKIINKLKEHNEYIMKLYGEFGIDYDKIPYVDDELVQLLDVLTSDGEWVSYYCYELNFGKDYHEGSITINNIPIDISTPEKLYNMLVADWNKKQEKKQMWNDWEVQLP